MGEDMALPRLYYTLPVLAEKWKKTEDDLLQMAAAGALRLSAFYDNCDLAGEDCYMHFSANDCKILLLNGCDTSDWGGICTSFQGEKVYTSGNMMPTAAQQFVRDEIEKFKREEYARQATVRDALDRLVPKKASAFPATIRSASDLLILPDEVARVEAIYPELIERKEAAVTSPIGHQLDPLRAIIGWKDIAERIGISTEYAKAYCKKNGIRIEHNNARRPWTTPEEIGRSRTAK